MTTTPTTSPRSCYTGWLLPEAERVILLGIVPAAYPDLVAHHVTHTFGVPCETPAPEERFGTIVGVADDGVGVQALVVQIGDTTMRPDGSVFHCTWSLDRASGARPMHSNVVIRERGFTPISPSVRVRLIPKVFRS